MRLIPSSYPLQFLHSPLGNPSKHVGPLRLVGEHALRERMCIVSPDAQEDIDMVIVSTPVKRRGLLGTAIQPPPSVWILSSDWLVAQDMVSAAQYTRRGSWASLRASP